MVYQTGSPYLPRRMTRSNPEVYPASEDDNTEEHDSDLELFPEHPEDLYVYYQSQESEIEPSEVSPGGKRGIIRIRGKP